MNRWSWDRDVLFTSVENIQLLLDGIIGRRV